MKDRLVISTCIRAGCTVLAGITAVWDALIGLSGWAAFQGAVFGICLALTVSGIDSILAELEWVDITGPRGLIRVKGASPERVEEIRRRWETS